MSLILKAKNWQIFTVIIIIPCLLFSLGIIALTNFSNFFLIFFAAPTAIIMSQMLIYIWIWTVSLSLWKKYNLKKYYQTQWLKILIILSLSILLIILGYFLWGASIMISGSPSISNSIIKTTWMILPLQVLFLGTKFYGYYFLAKMIKSAENDSIQTFNNIINDFILLIIFPLGIWYIQKKINKLALA